MRLASSYLLVSLTRVFILSVYPITISPKSPRAEPGLGVLLSAVCTALSTAVGMAYDSSFQIPPSPYALRTAVGSAGLSRSLRMLKGEGIVLVRIATQSSEFTLKK